MARPKYKSVKELYTATRKIHFEFRHDFTPKQTKVFMGISLINFIYSIFAAVYYTKTLPLATEYTENQFGIYGIISFFNLLVAYILQNKKIIKQERIREEALEIFMMIAAVAYLLWGFMEMIVSIVEGRETNYLIILMVYAVCTVYFYLSPHHYVVLFTACLICSKLVLDKYKPEGADIVIWINVILFGIILTIAGLSKYFAGLGQFLAQREADRLKEELEANNEELISTNDDLTETTEKLRQANEQQKLFTASMNHELRSPLNGIIGILQILRDDGSLSEENVENVERALVSSKTMLQIVNDLLDAAKLEAGEFTIINDEFNLHSILDAVETLSKGLAENKGLNLISETDPEMPCILVGDSVRIQQIIVNLVSNGIKYTDKGFVKIVTKMEEGNVLHIAVSDSGQGIASDAMDELFTPFKRLNAKENKKIQGTGLGLSVVKNLTEKMGGTITVESEFGKGSVFTVNIPVEIAQNSIKYGEYVNSYGKKDVKTVGIEGREILCVDDNKVNLAVFKGMFKGLGAEITVSSGGHDALEKLGAKKFDIVFLDHMMPDMDGLEVFERLRSEKGINDETPVVMLTGNVSEESKLEYSEKGLNGYLPKPIIKEDLLRKIDELLNK